VTVSCEVDDEPLSSVVGNLSVKVTVASQGSLMEFVAMNYILTTPTEMCLQQ
jgi:H2-forming N5,N10-methylenetetrahydromethanopterin dehydrogenase-like enzyme